LAEKHNASPLAIDYTSYTFAKMCGVCHPGGGALEFDRNGNRYDLFARNPANHILPGGTNDLDGDYFEANWANSGVMEADCLMCHVKDYHNDARKKQIGALNFRWAATAGAGFAKITGSVAEKEAPAVTYNLSWFGADGKVTLPVMKKPLNENCLFCHHESDWKKRGQSFSKRTDVHMRAGLLCVDCHVAGRDAADPRIHGKEEHQFGKGDDPGDFARKDLDNTMRTCEDCHQKGILNAPIPKHEGFPPTHFEHIACQTCHMPWRQVKAALMQDSSVFNTSPRISPPPKRIWSFYGPDMKPWNYYGFALGYPEGLQPLTQYRPVLGFHKGKIYPLNRVYTRWVGIKTDGKPGIGMPHMKDVFLMWKTHMDAPAKNYPLLSEIKDDNKDGFVEVNRPEEVLALLASVTRMLEKKGESLHGRQVVFVAGDRYTTDGKTWTNIPKKPYEYSPYGSVFKYSHDICPAKNALGAKGCADCHSDKSDFFFAKVMKQPFDGKGKPTYEPQYRLMGFDGHPRRYTGIAGATAAFFKWLTIVVLAGLFIHILLDFIGRRREIKKAHGIDTQLTGAYQRFNTNFLAQHLLLVASVILLSVSGIFLWGLRYPGAHWAAALTGMAGGIDFWRLVHRVGGLILIFACFYHLLYCIVHPEGRRDFLLMLPRTKDFVDLSKNLAWFVGRAKERPRFGRFAYFEKFDYWAVFWGCVIMVGTGLAMWFPEIVKLLVPGINAQGFDAFKEAHAHEALLAVAALFIWHVYNIHFRPGRFPGSLTWMHGRMSRTEKEQEHPEEQESR
jgi:thiosulfate reductase cytochrome b subunit